MMEIRKYQNSSLSSCTFPLRGLKHLIDTDVPFHHPQVASSSKTAKLPLPSFLRNVEQIKWESVWKRPCLWWSRLRDRQALTFVPFLPDGNDISVFPCCYTEKKRQVHTASPEAWEEVPARLCVLEQNNLLFSLWIFFRRYPQMVDMTSNIPSSSDTLQN